MPVKQLSVPRHVAFIMDGNGRWAKARGLPRVEGHRRGAKTVRTVIEESRRLGIRYITLFAFSTENWQRPQAEISALMQLFKSYLDSELSLLIENQIRLRAIGDRSRLPSGVLSALEKAEQRTAQLAGMDLILAVSYGGRNEIVRAAKTLAQRYKLGELADGAFNENAFSQALDAPDVPDPDLLIRTSDENRISNFLLWQLAYSEIVVSPLCWPDFDAAEYQRCLTEFNSRDRRFGLTADQLNANETRVI